MLEADETKKPETKDAKVEPKPAPTTVMFF